MTLSPKIADLVMSALEQKAEANRRNAQMSTGPRTPEGKAVSKLNALKHGLTAKNLMLPGEDAAEFDQLRDGLVQGLCPVGALEAELVGRIAACMWRLRRVYNIERGILLMQRLEDEITKARGAKWELEQRLEE